MKLAYKKDLNSRLCVKFMDGNGRVGRLFLAVTIEEWCESTAPWLYMSEFFDQNKDHYIDKMFAVSATGEWSDWVRFCLGGVISQAKDAAERCGALIDLNRRFHELVIELSATTRLPAIVDNLFLNPIVLSRMLATGPMSPAPRREVI